METPTIQIYIVGTAKYNNKGYLYLQVRVVLGPQNRTKFTVYAVAFIIDHFGGFPHDI
jgi:hypothetical protein